MSEKPVTAESSARQQLESAADAFARVRGPDREVPVVVLVVLFGGRRVPPGGGALRGCSIRTTRRPGLYTGAALITGGAPQHSGCASQRPAPAPDALDLG
ncbi:hypothetical protein SALBM135S_00795 [Streptomyces alboniger]